MRQALALSTPTSMRACVLVLHMGWTRRCPCSVASILLAFSTTAASLTAAGDAALLGTRSSLRPPCEPCVQPCCKDYLCPLEGPDSSCNASTPRVRGATDVFVGGSANYSFHRIPSLVQTADGALLVFAQCGGLPANSSDVVVRRSTNTGLSWDEEQLVVAQHFHGGPMLP